MDVVEGVDQLRPEHGRLFMVVGVFDGLHRGHRYLLRHLRREAALRTTRPAIITFDAHPDEVIVGAAPPLLCDPDERLARLASAGVAVTVVQRFDDALRGTSYRDFVDAIRARVDLAGFLLTPDAAFGHGRRGTPETLAELGREIGFEVVVVPPFELGERPVRSGTIRVDIAAGDLNGARRLLGRPVAVVGDAALGALADGDPGGDRGPTTRLTFPIPVALPPEGRYRATVEPAWSPLGRIGVPVRAVAEVTADGVAVEGGIRERVGPLTARLRVAFTRELSPPAQAGSDD